MEDLVDDVVDGVDQVVDDDFGIDSGDGSDFDGDEDIDSGDDSFDNQDDSSDDQDEDGDNFNDEDEDEDEDDCNFNFLSVMKNLIIVKKVIVKVKSFYKNIKVKIFDFMKEIFKEFCSQYQFIKGLVEQFYVKVFFFDDDDYFIDYELEDLFIDDMVCELKALNKIVKDVKKLEEKGFKFIKDLEKEDW